MKHTVMQEGVPDRVYEGFRYVDMRSQPDFIAVALFDGDADLYEVDPVNIETAKKEIVRKYEDDYDRGPSTLTIYSRV